MRFQTRFSPLRGTDGRVWEGRAEACRRGDIIPACLASPWRRTLFLDLDVKVCGGRSPARGEGWTRLVWSGLVWLAQGTNPLGAQLGLSSPLGLPPLPLLVSSSIAYQSSATKQASFQLKVNPLRVWGWYFF
jgi:hypothetical protein